MIPQNSKNEKVLSEINIQFINAIRELKISSLLKQSKYARAAALGMGTAERNVLLLKSSSSC